MYKEFRDVSLNGAMSQMYQEMKGKHRTPHESIQIIKTTIVPDKDVLREATRTWAKRSLVFPKVKPLKRAPTQALKTTFKATRPLLLWAGQER